MVNVQPSPTVTRSSVEPETVFQSSGVVVGAAAVGCSALPSGLALSVGSRVAGLDSISCGGLAEPPESPSVGDDEPPLPQEARTSAAATATTPRRTDLTRP